MFFLLREHSLPIANAAELNTNIFFFESSDCLHEQIDRNRKFRKVFIFNDVSQYITKIITEETHSHETNYFSN